MARTCVYLVYCSKRSNTLLVTVYLTWMSTICVVIMATYGRTLCWEKRNTVQHRWGVCCWGNIADHGHYRCEAIMGYALGCGRSVLRAIRCASCHAGCSQSLSLCGAAQYRTRSLTPGPRGSYCSIPSRRWYLLEIVEARLHGEGLSVFSRGVLIYLRYVGVVPILPCMENIELWCVGAA